MQNLGTTIRSRRRSLRLSLAQAAQRAGCSKAYLSGIENDRHRYPPSDTVLGGLERALDMATGTLVAIADWQRTPASVRARLAASGLRLEENAEPARLGVAPADFGPRAASLEPVSTPLRRIPVINRIAAGGPAEYTDLDYPVDVADEYTAAPLGSADADGAFAARVVGDSMLPLYREGDVVVFSPNRDAADGSDCFVRLLPDHSCTFKRVFFEAGGTVKLVPLNPDHEPRTVDREQVAGLWPAVSVVRQVVS